MTTSPRRFFLRERTQEAHAAVDGAVGSLSSLDIYKRYLRGMQSFRGPIEARLEQAVWPEAMAALRAEPLSGLLDHDMDDLGLTPLPRQDDDAPDVDLDLSWLIGTLYVLEGSTLGAQLLIKQAGALGLSASFGARHLAQQATGMERWRGFVAILETAEPIDLDRTTQASLATFAAADRAFREAFHGSH